MILSDLPLGVTSPISKYTGEVTTALNQMFGLPADTIIWQGKPVVAAFSNKRLFAAFEELVMDNPNHGGLPSVRYWKGSMLRTMVVTEMNQSLAWNLVWGLSNAYYVQAQSSYEGYEWLKAGISYYTASRLTSPASHIERRHRRVSEALKRDQTLYGILSATEIRDEHRRLCADLVDFLITADTSAFRQLVIDSKIGFPVEDGLKRNFGTDSSGLANAFGRSLRVPNVTP